MCKGRSREANVGKPVDGGAGREVKNDEARIQRGGSCSPSPVLFSRFFVLVGLKTALLPQLEGDWWVQVAVQRFGASSAHAHRPGWLGLALDWHEAQEMTKERPGAGH